VILAALLAAAAAAATPSPEALDLARKVAANGVLATLGPLQTQSELEEMIKDNPDLTEAERTRLRAIGESQAEALIVKVIETQAATMAVELSVEDLRALAAFTGSPAALHQRDAMPKIILATMQALDGIDYADDVKAAFCAETRKLCDDD
jgi:hypothetical protein